ncbi:MAG: DcrB-related protein [Chloroflexi bacterium]|nr:DcrB-related protein [Chloroflexota bacterium]
MRKPLHTILGVALALALLLPYFACQPVETPSPPPAETAGPLGTPPPAPPGATPATTATPAPQPTPKPATPKPSPSPTRKPAPPPPTVAPTAKPEPGVYRNETHGFVIRYPAPWTAQETGERSPIVRIFSPGAYPVVLVELNATTELTTPTKYAQDQLTQWRTTLNRFNIDEQKDITLGDVPAYQAVFSWVSDNVTLKAKMLFVLRGSQAFVVYGLAPRADFDNMVQITDAILTSFRLEDPKPFGVARGQAVTLVDNGPTTMDPALSREASSHSYIIQVFSGLVSLDKKLNIVPAVAERWDVTDGGKVYTFRLRRDATFHNGRAVTANDFKYSWERAAKPATKSLTVETYLGDVVGVKDMLAGRAQEIQGVKVIDDHTLQVTIDGPKAYFLAKLTYPTAFVVDRDNVERGGGQGNEWWRRPNGTGPFRLMEWQKDQLLILARNDQYYGDAPASPFVVYRLLGGVPMIMYQTGEVDVADVGIGDIDRVRDPSNPLSRELKVFPVLAVDYIAFSIDKPPFDDAKVRQAFNHAVDKNKIIERVLKGTRRKAAGILPPGIPGFNPELKGLDFDVEKAKQLIAESKYGSVANFPPIKITTAGSTGDVSDFLAAIIQEWKQNLGVSITVRGLDPESFSYIIKEERDEMIIGGWVADYPDPEDFLDVLFHTGSQANDSNYSNPELDRLLDQARVEQDAARRLKMYQEIEQKLVDDAAAMPLWYSTQYLLVKPYVKDFELSPLGYPLLEQASLLPR